MKKKFFWKKALSFGMAMSAFACSVPVAAESGNSLAVYAEVETKSLSIHDARELMKQYVEEQNLPVKDVFCELRDYWNWSGTADSVIVAYDAQENPEVKSILCEFMSENGIAEDGVVFYDLSTKIQDPDVIYDMICTCIEENDLHGIYHIYKSSEVLLDEPLITVPEGSIVIHGICNLRTEGILGEFIIKSGIDRTRVGHQMLEVAEYEIDPVTSEIIVPPWIKKDETIDISTDFRYVTPGDVNEDGEIGIMDVVLMNRVIVGVEQVDEIQRKSADVDGDGKVTLSDSMKVLQYIVGLITEL